MQSFKQNISNKLNQFKKRPKCQSSNIRSKNPPQISFEFKSSLFTEKNRSLIAKLVSQSISPDNSFSKDKKLEKIKIKSNKCSTTTKTKNIKTVNNSRIYNHRIFQDINNYNMKIFQKKIMKKKNNSTFPNMNNGVYHYTCINSSSITNCQIQPIKKRNFKIKISNNNTIKKKKLILNGMAHYNKSRNNSVKVKLNFNLNSSVKCIYAHKKLKCSIKNMKPNNLRNSVNNKNNINMITVNTISLKKKKHKINNLKLIENKNKPKIMVNQKYRNTFYYH